MLISAWSSDVCPSDCKSTALAKLHGQHRDRRFPVPDHHRLAPPQGIDRPADLPAAPLRGARHQKANSVMRGMWSDGRSEEHTSELQSLMRISYAVFCLKKKKNQRNTKPVTVIGWPVMLATTYEDA